MRLAHARLADETGVVFARRVVTRPSGSSEDHDSLVPEDFVAARASGAFCLSWSANGLHYGLPAHLADDMRCGRTVVANGSRAVVADARRLFPRVFCVLVTAPPEVLAGRLAARDRAENLQERLVRGTTMDLSSPADAIIENVGSPDDGAAILVRLIRQSLSGNDKDQAT